MGQTLMDEGGGKTRGGSPLDIIAKKARNQSNRGASRRRCSLRCRSSSGRGLIFFGNRRAAAGCPHLVRVTQGHVLRFPPAVRLHHVERGVIEEGIERPVVAQVVGREALDPDLAAKDRDALIDGPGGQRLFRVVAGEERPPLPSHLREVGLGRHPRVPVQLLDIRAVRFGAVDPDRSPTQVDRVGGEQRHLAAAQRVLNQQTHQQRIAVGEEQVMLTRGWPLGMRGDLLEGGGLDCRDLRGHGLLMTLSGRDPPTFAVLVQVARLPPTRSSDGQDSSQGGFIQYTCPRRAWSG